MRHTDNSTRVIVRLRFVKTAIVRAVYLLRVSLRCWLWKIQLGKNIILEGMPILYRNPGSNFSIGDGSQLLSAPRSNFAGINRPCTLSTLRPNANLKLGKRCGLSGTVISAAISVTLGDDVLCGANTTILDNDFHHLDPARRNDHRDIPAAAVWIEDNVWLGMGSTVLKGVHIGRNSVIAAGSIVVQSIPANVLAGGIPARVLKKIDASLSSKDVEHPSPASPSSLPQEAEE